jgi:FkbM family methyltransferase
MKFSQVLVADDRRVTLEAWCRGQAYSVYLGHEEALCRVLGDLLMYVPSRDLSLSPHLMMSGFWEMWVTIAISRHVKPGMRCIDVGANSGYYTLLLCDLVGSQKPALVSAYEPQPKLAGLLRRSLAANGFSQGLVEERAVSSETGSAYLSEVPLLTGSASLHRLIEPGTTTAVVQTVSLDEDGHGDSMFPIDFVKIDVQGYEMEVLRGMQRVIKNSPNVAIAMEFTPGEYDSPSEALLEIQKMGLDVKAIGTDGIVRPITLADAARPNTGDHRMLWLTRAP